MFAQPVGQRKVYVCNIEPIVVPQILFNIGSGNGLAPVWCQAITWTNIDLS